MWGISSVVRAIDLHSIGHELESHILQTKHFILRIRLEVKVRRLITSRGYPLVGSISHIRYQNFLILYQNLIDFGENF